MSSSHKRSPRREDGTTLDEATSEAIRLALSEPRQRLARADVARWFAKLPPVQ